MNKTIGKININSSLHKWILLIAFFIYPKLIFSEWTAVNSPVGGAVLTLINKDGLLFANAFGAGIYKSTNNGRIWEQATNAIPNLRFSTSIASNSNYIYASSARSGIFRSSDNGASWQEIHDGKSKSGNAFDVNVIRTFNSSVYLCTNSGLFVSNNNGDTWFERNDTLPSTNFKDIVQVEDTLYLATENGFFISENSGDYWNKYAFLGLNVYKLFKSGSNIYICVFDPSSSSNNFYSIYQKSEGKDSLQIYHEDIFFNSQILEFNQLGDKLAISSVSRTETGFNFKIHYSNDYGSNWTNIYDSKSELQDLTSGLVLSESSLYAGTRFKGIKKMNLDGSNIEFSNQSIYNIQITSIAFDNENIFAGTEENGIYYSSDNGYNWNQLINSPKENNGSYKKINKLLIQDNKIYLAAKNGIDYSSDKGLNWISLGWTDYNMQDLLIEGNKIFAIGNSQSGYLFVSEDNGKSWIPRKMPDNAVVYSFMKNNANIFVGTSLGIMKSVNDGIDWKIVNQELSGSFASLSIVNANHTILASSYKGIMLSLDEGESWQTSNKGLKGLIIHNLFAFDKYIYVASESGVYFSMDGGHSWEEFNSGLNNFEIFNFALYNKELYAVPLGDVIYKTNLSSFTKISMGNLPTSIFCTGMEFNVNYTISGNISFNADNNFIVELSDFDGNFDAENIVIGSIKSNNSGDISVRIPDDIQNGTNYRIRIVSTSPEYKSYDNLSDLTIINRIKPEITGAGNSCTAYQETYSINENPGYNYKWSVNLGTIIGKDNQGTVIIRWEAPGTGKLKIIIDNLSQCQDSSEISVTINPAPPKPSISVTNGKLISDSQYGNLWFLDGVSLPDTLNAITPVIDGNYTVRVTNQFACYSESSEPFSFENNSDFIVFSIDTISAYSGDNFFLNIRMLKNKKFYESNISKLSATLVCNSSMLFSLGDDKGAVVKGKRYLNLNLDTNYITENIIASLPFMAMLGDAETSTITLDRVRINGIPELNTKVRTGLFSMLGICYDGGPRLITSTLASEILSINPNPASRELNIEIFVGNDEDIKLELINNNGVVEKLFLSKHLKMGYYQFTYYVNEFSNGEYFVKLQSGTSVSSNKIILSK